MNQIQIYPKTQTNRYMIYYDISIYILKKMDKKVEQNNK